MRPLTPLLVAASSAARGGQAALVAMMSSDYGFTHNLPNAFFASTPRHPLWHEALAALADAARAWTEDVWVEEVGWPGPADLRLHDSSAGLPSACLACSSAELRSARYRATLHETPRLLHPKHGGTRRSRAPSS